MQRPSMMPLRGPALCLSLIGAMAIGGTALADRGAADRCAASLPVAGKTLYDRALPAVVVGGAIPDALRSVARGLVMAGSMTRDTARPAAEAAGACLVHLNAAP